MVMIVTVMVISRVVMLTMVMMLMLVMMCDRGGDGGHGTVMVKRMVTVRVSLVLVLLLMRKGSQRFVSEGGEWW